MGIEVGLAAAALAVTTYGTVKQVQANKEQASAQQESIRAQQQAEAARKQAAELDAMRRRREIVRNSIKSRSVALSTAISQGAGDSSGATSGSQNITSQEGVNLQGVDQNLALGGQIFDANQSRFAAESRGVSAASSALTYGAISSLGGAVLKNTDRIDRIGTTLFSKIGGGGGFSYSSYAGNR